MGRIGGICVCSILLIAIGSFFAWYLKSIEYGVYSIVFVVFFGYLAFETIRHAKELFQNSNRWSELALAFGTIGAGVIRLIIALFVVVAISACVHWTTGFDTPKPLQIAMCYGAWMATTNIYYRRH